MHKIIFLIFILFSFKILAFTKYTYDSIPNPTLQNLYISNPDKVLEDIDANTIDQKLKLIEQRTSHEIAVVLIQDIDSDDSKNFAVQLFNHWGIGKKGKDNGLLILLVINKRKVEIEVGYGLEGVITDLYANRIIQNIMIPKLREEKYSEAILESLDEIEMHFNSDVNSDKNSDNLLNDKSENTLYDHPLNKLNMGPLVDKNGKLSPLFYFFCIFSLIFGIILFKFLKTFFQNIKEFSALDKEKKRNVIISILIFVILIVGLNLLEEYFFVVVFYLVANIVFYKATQKKYHEKIFNYVSQKSNDFPYNFVLRVLFSLVSIYVFSKRIYRKYKIKKMHQAGFQHVSEESENSYLSPSQITEERIGAAEYDVFVDSNSKKIEIDKTTIALGKFIKCKKCDTQALYVEKDVVISSPSSGIDGSGIKHMHCSHCNDRHDLPYTISSSSNSSSSGFSSGSSSGGGSSFGGGSSGGGGASGKW